MKKTIVNLALMGSLAIASNMALADCKILPKHADLKAALIAARNQANGGFNLDMWGTIVDRNGVVCAVAFTGVDVGDQWPGSRVISAQKANTANAFSLPNLALSTANLYKATQPGGSLFGLQESNPIDATVAYKAQTSSKKYGQPSDPLVGKKAGGVNVFGGGLALYNNDSGDIVGALGVSGDSSCADHNIAWRTRNNLVGFNLLPSGVGPGSHDGIDYNQASGWAHPVCDPAAVTIAKSIGAGSD
jgi:uncharacterized protein GlcG (DUF336 family)